MCFFVSPTILQSTSRRVGGNSSNGLFGFWRNILWHKSPWVHGQFTRKPPCYCGQDSMVSDANPSSTCTKTGHQGQVSSASASNISVDIKFYKLHNQATYGSHQVLPYIMPYIDIYAHTIYTYITWFSKIVEYGVPLCSDDSMSMIQSLF